jgi:HAD superfamily hydrolase (TIGR01509 family)
VSARGARPRALLWDNDGVLVDSEPLFFQATREVLAGYGIALDEERYVHFSMREGRSLFDLVAERGVGDEEIRAQRERRDARYAALLGEGVRVLEGVREALAALSGRLPMAIVTASGREHFELIHEPLGLLAHFEFVLASGDYPRHKPHPDGYLAAASRLGLDPAECLVVEDSERGLRSALAAGMRCVVVPGGFSRGGDFAGAWRVLDSAHEVPTVFEVLVGGATGAPRP